MRDEDPYFEAEGLIMCRLVGPNIPTSQGTVRDQYGTMVE
jgi:hypothetical protein